MIDVARLKSQLLRSQLQIKDPPLFQVINLLIDALNEVQGTTSGGGGSTTSVTNIVNNLTQMVDLFGSSDGSGDDFISPPSSGGTAIDRQWSVLTNGDPVSPELIFADGDVIMTHIP